jgi:hypothetical protein
VRPALGASSSDTLSTSETRSVPTAFVASASDVLSEADTATTRSVLVTSASETISDANPVLPATLLVVSATASVAREREMGRFFDQDGRLHVRQATICKANVCPYRGCAGRTKQRSWEHRALSSAPVGNNSQATESLTGDINYIVAGLRATMMAIITSSRGSRSRCRWRTGGLPGQTSKREGV